MDATTTKSAKRFFIILLVLGIFSLWMTFNRYIIKKDFDIIPVNMDNQ